MRPDSGMLMLPGLEDRVGHPLFERRRGHHRRHRARHLLLPEGPGAEVSPAPDPYGQDRHRRDRHPAQHRAAHRVLFPAAPGGADRELPAAHASARQGDDDGSDPAHGTDVVLSHVAEFNFNWHNAYVFADHAAPLLPKGRSSRSRRGTTTPPAHKSNPDPNVWVGYGDRTVDEMAHAWVNVTYLTDEDYLAEVEARRATLAATNATAAASGH